ncbi:hypothetical protein HYX16_05355, partial [Candidatus Woesearchaeota archaeon]|nr:hypothetical protein [Candidatus Woesearchaeota archaeon]
MKKQKFGKGIKNKEIEIKGLSKIEVKIIAWLEFYQRYFFTIKDIEPFFEDNFQRYNTIKSLVKKKRIIKLNKNKYYLVPIKAKSGAWIPHEFVIVDEICNSGEYYI